MTKRTLIPLVAIMMIIAGIGCRERNACGDTFVVVVPAQQWLLQQLLDDNSINVNCLMRHGADPETFELSMQQLGQLSHARLLFSTGDPQGFERTLIDKALDNNSQLRVINTAASVARLTTHHHGDDHGDNSDPHIWTSVRNLKAMATTMATTIKTEYPARQASVTSRLQQLQQHLDSIDTDLDRRLKRARCRTFVVWHPALAYFARDYNLRQIAIDDGHELTALHLKQTIDEIARSGAKVMFVQQGVDSRQALTIAHDMNLEIVNVDLMSSHWQQQLTQIADAISRQ